MCIATLFIIYGIILDFSGIKEFGSLCGIYIQTSPILVSTHARCVKSSHSIFPFVSTLPVFSFVYMFLSEYQGIKCNVC